MCSIEMSIEMLHNLLSTTFFRFSISFLIVIPKNMANFEAFHTILNTILKFLSVSNMHINLAATKFRNVHLILWRNFKFVSHDPI